MTGFADAIAGGGVGLYALGIPCALDSIAGNPAGHAPGHLERGQRAVLFLYVALTLLLLTLMDRFFFG